jgi:hypothetical protein
MRDRDFDYFRQGGLSMKRCDQCAFWVEGEAWSGTQPVEGTLKDNHLGTCHRHAPRPTKGEFEYRVLQALVLNVPEGEEADDLYKHWEESVEANRPIWPTTSAIDWCGDYSAK